MMNLLFQNGTKALMIGVKFIGKVIREVLLAILALMLGIK
jgi:hypothetical protein